MEEDATVSVKARVAIAATESLDLTVKVAVPAIVGVPLKTPAVDRVNPAGKGPVVTLQLYGAVPPAAARVWELAVPTVTLLSAKLETD